MLSIISALIIYTVAYDNKLNFEYNRGRPVLLTRAQPPATFSLVAGGTELRWSSEGVSTLDTLPLNRLVQLARHGVILCAGQYEEY